MVIDELGACEMFANLERDALLQLGHEIAMLGIAAGQVLFQQGDAADGLYVVLRGRRRAHRRTRR